MALTSSRKRVEPAPGVQVNEVEPARGVDPLGEVNAGGVTVPDSVKV